MADNYLCFNNTYIKKLSPTTVSLELCVVVHQVYVSSIAALGSGIFVALCASSQGHSERQAGIVSLYHLYSSEMDERCTQEFTIDESNYRCSSELPEARLSGGFVFLHRVYSSSSTIRKLTTVFLQSCPRYVYLESGLHSDID